MATATTPLELKLLATLKRIASYEAPDRLRRNADMRYGLDGDEAVEMAYENMQQEARNAVRGVRVKTMLTGRSK